MDHRSAFEVREVPESQIDRALDLAYLAFHEKPPDDRRKQHHEQLRESGRIGAYDGDSLVGFAEALPFDLSVPGGELPCMGLSFVAVAPTHRRRGVLSGMIADLHRRCAAEGRPIAALWASEDIIYGRFGFGAATDGVNVEIDSRTPLRLRIDADDRPLRLVDPADVPALIGPYYEATRTARAGRFERTETRWRNEWLAATDEDDGGLGPPRVVALGDPIAGYAVYRTKGGDPHGLVRLDELEADTPAAAAALWRYLASIDLTATVRAWGRPSDDPLLLFAADRDQVRVVGGAPLLRVRLVDVRAAMEGRSWAAAADLVLDVRDGLRPENAGRHRLTATPEGCTYRPADGPADLTVDVRDLASCHMGCVTAGALVRAGLIGEHTPGAAAALDAALRTDLRPHTVETF
ncbi:putative acetyltransferase [Murinocardiopsis flavida]|uniref:Putative acetyltransferase n=1 Tax=Murinocardiopsis flavida TaxID=645275 RepID=A0A2P8CQX6_9ACTN|nr:GNAT family N-acetyltransferase [Murinocardiopsis flavida]PSK87368.1 putative acetyltransferase [Murinocardiopsis flavida]